MEEEKSVRDKKMKGKKRQHSDKFKAKVALEAIKGEKTIAELSSLYQVHATQITRWKQQVIDSLPDAFSDKRKKEAADEEQTKDELYKQIGQLKVELDWLKKKSGLIE
jgi:putative transposase